jgi:cytochrome c556
MREISRSFAMVGAAIALIAAAGCSQGPQSGTAAAVDEDSPQYRAFEYRHGLMHVIGFKVGPLRGMAQGKVPVDEALFKQNADDLAAVSGMIVEGFPEGSGDIPDSRALPAIWSDWDDFVSKAQDLHTAAEALADAADSGGFAAAKDRVQAVGDSCGGCHRQYREEEDE